MGSATKQIHPAQSTGPRCALMTNIYADLFSAIQKITGFKVNLSKSRPWHRLCKVFQSIKPV
jgi:hypothetical protein